MNIIASQKPHPCISNNLLHKNLDQCVGKYTIYAYKMNHLIINILICAAYYFLALLFS
jgi:hypothetical protein